MDELIEKIHQSLRKGEATQALDDLYLLCRRHASKYLEEVVSQITRIQLIYSNDRAGILSFEERIRLEAQTSSSILKLLNLIEHSSSESSPPNLVEKTRKNLDVERQKRIDAERRILELEQSLRGSKQDRRIEVRDYVVGTKVECNISALSHSVTSENNYAVVLSEIGTERRLPIIIGGFEAQAIAVSLENMTPSRPLTHDLTKNIIEALGYTIKEIVIDDLSAGVFGAKVVMISKGQYIEINSRTSDALALAVRFKVPIYVLDFILDAASVTLTENADTKQESESNEEK